MDLYSQPELYRALRAPDPDTLVLVRRLIDQHLEGPFQSLLDPACGPGTWLEPFRTQLQRVAGNDLSPEMVESAREIFADQPCEFTVGDMRSLDFRHGPFDVAMEVSGSASHLPDPKELRRLLAQMGRHTRVGGLVLLTVFMESQWQSLTAPMVTWRSAPVELPDGRKARIQYTIIGRDPPPGTSTETIVRRVEVIAGTKSCCGESSSVTAAAAGRTRSSPAIEHSHDCEAASFEDTYTLRIWSTNEIRATLASLTQLQLVGLHSIDETDGLAAGSVPLPKTQTLDEPLKGEYVLVLKRV